MNTSQESFNRLPSVIKKTGLARSTIYALIKEKKFPAPFHPTPRTSVWTESSLQDWMEEQKKAGLPNETT